MTEPAHREFRALGTDCVVIVADGSRLDATLDAVHAEIDAVDQACSRFRGDSDLEAVNHSAGQAVQVSPVLIEAIELAQRASELTDGDLDPTVGAAMCALGYDRDFGEVPPSSGEVLTVQRVAGWRRIELDRSVGTVRIPAGASLDLGATAKAWAADRAAAAAAAVNGSSVLVSLGGDIATGGAPPAGGWGVHIADDHAAPIDGVGQDITIESGAVATSSTTVRRWQRNGRPLHHVIDPSTSLPAEDVWRTVSVAAGTCADANIASTTSIIRGERALDWLEQQGLPARLVARDGEIHHVNGWPTDGEARMTAMVATSSSQALWFISRGTGAVSLVLVTASMLLGIVTTARLESRNWPRFVIERLHRNVSLSLLVFIIIHIASTVIDGFAPIGFLDAVVPFHSPYRTIWLGLGTVAFDLLLALAITSVVRVRLGYRVWRAIHYAAYGCWPIALLHGFEIGSDRHERWMLGLDVASVVLVAAAGLWRWALHPHDRPQPPDPATVRPRRVPVSSGRARR